MCAARCGWWLLWASFVGSSRLNAGLSYRVVSKTNLLQAALAFAGNGCLGISRVDNCVA